MIDLKLLILCIDDKSKVLYYTHKYNIILLTSL